MAVPTDDKEFREYLLKLLADPEMARAVHQYVEVDKARTNIHHTVGPQLNQAASN